MIADDQLIENNVWTKQSYAYEACNACMLLGYDRDTNRKNSHTYGFRKEVYATC